MTPVLNFFPFVNSAKDLPPVRSPGNVPVKTKWKSLLENNRAQVLKEKTDGKPDLPSFIALEK